MLKTLNELCFVIAGGTPKTSNQSYWNGGIPWVSIKDFISCNRFINSTEKSISEAGLKNSATHLLLENDIIISARGTVGEVAILNKPMTFNQSCFGLRTKDSSLLNQMYLFYWLKANKRNIQTGSHGAVFNTITRNDFDRLKINLPTLNDQCHIVDTILSHLFF